MSTQCGQYVLVEYRKIGLPDCSACERAWVKLRTQGGPSGGVWLMRSSVWAADEVASAPARTIANKASFFTVFSWQNRTDDQIVA